MNKKLIYFFIFFFLKAIGIVKGMSEHRVENLL
jgi:hypothetical protein